MNTTKMEPFAGFSGRGVRVAIIDSGVNPAHPHVAGLAGGICLNPNGASYEDDAGHGTAVAGAIREKAPEALLYAVKVFDQRLRTKVEIILQALDWAIENQMQVVNLSLGTTNPAHRARFEQIIARALDRNLVLVAAHEMNEQPALPGVLPGVLPVGLDWDCPRESYRAVTKEAQTVFLASGYPRPIPGLPLQQNLNGISFAVANMTGLVVRAKQAYPEAPLPEIVRLLTENQCA